MKIIHAAILLVMAASLAACGALVAPIVRMQAQIQSFHPFSGPACGVGERYCINVTAVQLSATECVLLADPADLTILPDDHDVVIKWKLNTGDFEFRAGAIKFKFEEDQPRNQFYDEQLHEGKVMYQWKDRNHEASPPKPYGYEMHAYKVSAKLKCYGDPTIINRGR